jgi:CO dehydrogenase nickel-insertion accessory protein CooC1
MMVFELQEGAFIAKTKAVVINKSPSPEVSFRITDELTRNGLCVIGELPKDPMVFEAGLQGRTIDEGPAFAQSGEVMNRLLQRTV